MKVTLDQIKRLLGTYRLKVYRIHPMENGFTVETQKGRKILSIWENADLLKWSNGWREELAGQGYKTVERFLVNQNRKKFIRYSGKYFVLTDAPDGRKPNPEDQAECRNLGEVFARLHLAVDRIDSGTALVSLTDIDDEFFADSSTKIKQAMHAIETMDHPGLIDEMIYVNLPQLYKRFRRAHQIWESVKDSVIYFPISFAGFRIEQLTETADGWFISGGRDQKLAVLHQDTACLIRELYEKSGWNPQAVPAFLEGYEKYRKLTDNELVYILVQLVVPWEVWTHFTQYLKNNHLTDAQADALTEAIMRQQHWDEMTVQLARLIDHRNEATA